MHSIERGIGCYLAAFLVCGWLCPSAQARLGEPFKTFKAKAETSYKFLKEDKKDDRTYESFVMILNEKLKASAPNFAVAETLTVVDGKIVGQSMMIRIGDNYEGGKAMAIIHAMDFAYESLGKPAPTKDGVEKEYRQYEIAVTQVLAGLPQKIQYPGFKAKITLSRSNDGELLLAATPDLSAGETQKDKGPAKPAAKTP